MIIENCCCHNQLPGVAKTSYNEGRVVGYTTNGDVTVERVLFSVACLVGRASVLTLVIPKFDIHLLRYLNHGYERGWWANIHILTAEGQEAHIRAELTNATVKTLKVVEDKRISSTSQLIMIEGMRHLCGEPGYDHDEAGKSIVLTGYHPVVSPVDNGQPYRLCNHQLMYRDNDKHQALWDEVTKIPLTPLRIRK